MQGNSPHFLIYYCLLVYKGAQSTRDKNKNAQNKPTKQNKLKNPTKQNNLRTKTQTQVGKISTIKPQQKRTKKPIPTTTRKTRQKATFENTFCIENLPRKVGEPSAVEKLDSFLDGNPLKTPSTELSDSD